MEIDNSSIPVISYLESLINNVKSESIKVRDTPIAKVLFTMTILLTISMCVAMNMFRLETATSWIDILNGIASPSITLLALPFILLVCEEWSNGTALISYTLTPNRTLVMLSKFLVLMLTFLVVTVILVLVTYVNATVCSNLFSYSVDLSFDVGKVVALMMPLLINMLLGFSMSVLSQDKTIAIALYFMIPPITVIAEQIPALQDYAKWVSLGHSSSIFAAGITNHTTAQYVSSLLIWLLIPSIIGGIWNAKKDIN